MSYDEMVQEGLQRAFNEGCDARIAGIHWSRNPYGNNRYGSSCASYWRRGWDDVDLYWCRKDACMRKRKPLPIIGEAR